MLTLDAAAAALDSGETTSRALVEACLARIEDEQGEGARTFRAVYATQARQSADAMDTLREAGRAPGRFAGIPISLKDLLDVAGEPTPAASVALAGASPASRHATVVQRVLAAGLIPVGRTNMTEFAFSGVGINPHYGTPRAPFDRATGRIPGGSSSGAAVSVADGMALAAIGTDTGGSCRIPAAFCGVPGFKPTARRVPRDGVLPLSATLDSVGPLAPTVRCCAIMDAILAGEAPKSLPPPRPAAGLRLMMPINLVLDGMDAIVERTLDATVQRLDRAGVIVDHLPLRSFDLAVRAHARGGFAVVESYAWHRDLIAHAGTLYDPRVLSRMLPGADMAASDYVALVAARAEAIATFVDEMATYDALVMPTVPIVPPPIAAFDEDEAYRRLNNLILRNSAQINFLDGCAISLPCHDNGSAPVGLTLAAPAMEDRRLLDVAASIEAALRPNLVAPQYAS